MKLGFASIYAFRPHVEHNEYLAHLARQDGHNVVYLTCDAQLANCYVRELKGTGRIECAKCMLGGVRSYAAASVSSLSFHQPALDATRAREFAFSSTCTILRTEPPSDWRGADFHSLQERLAAAAARAYSSARRWIESEGLDAVVCFNGRFEVNRAVIEAAADAGLPYLTVERTWFGDGLQFAVNANALDLSQLDRLNAAFRSVPLSAHQAYRVGRKLAQRVLRRNDHEWRAYNRHAESVPWPAKGLPGRSGPRVLILPSSRNEVDGHPDWSIRWAHLADGLDLILERLGADPAAAVLRCHPNWAERIGQRTGARSERYYADWSARSGAHLIASTSTASTFDLIAHADVVIVTGGTAAFEAAAFGKPVIALAPSTYQTAGIALPVYGPESLDALSALHDLQPRERIRLALRYGYTHVYRFSQYVDYVRAVTTTRYRYLHGADPGRLQRMLLSGLIEPDDALRATGTEGEDEVIDGVAAGDWESFMGLQKDQPGQVLRIRRRAALRWLDDLRERFPRGDL